MTRPARTRRRPGRVPLVVVGFGRLGGALAIGLHRAGWPVSVLPRSAEGVRKAATLRLTLADHELLHDASACILAVPDAAVAQAAELVDEDLGEKTALIHLSGALPLTVFATGRPVASFHPLVAVSDAHDELAGHAVALAASTKPLMAVVEHMAEALELTPIAVPDEGRAAYHAGAVMGAGLLAALADAAVSALEHAGLNRDAALSSLLPLMRSALRAVELRGLEKGLTGPVVRGDVGVVQAHLEALPPELGGIYRLLSRRALRLTTTLPAETRAALERLLV